MLTDWRVTVLIWSSKDVTSPKFQDLLTKEQKEAVLDKKMEEMRRKNATREKRYAVCNKQPVNNRN